jgi:SNF2 family DNA or RNA helicase
MSTLTIVHSKRKSGNFAVIDFQGSEADWPRVRSIFARSEDTKFLESTSLELPWPSFLRHLKSLRALDRRGVRIRPDTTARKEIKRFLADRKIRDSKVVKIAVADIQDHLEKTGWTRQLRPPQLRDVEKLLSLPHGANFSVPGAGKTTVTFAVHSLAADPNWKFLVICPPSAFGAWAEVVDECVDQSAPYWVQEPFMAVSGKKGTELRRLLTEHTRIVTNYEHLVNNQNDFSNFLFAGPTHVVVDESHRIKSGRGTRRGKAVLDLSDLPVRKDILSGTPAPQSRMDFVSQFEFLWNDPKLTSGIANEGQLKPTIGDLYVRTTKADLGLEPPNKSFVRVPMSMHQALLYAMVKDDLVKHRMSFEREDRASLDRLRKSVFTLLVLMTNPLVAVRRLEFDAQLANNQDMLELLRLAATEGHSSKIDTCVNMVEDLVSSGKKALVWSSFRSNGEILEDRLAHLNPLPMHGGIPVGDRDTPDTREHNRMLFHGDDHHVIIANPAACSEGMSLHKACHDAIYLDRTFNAAHYLQSIDRIHRLGLDPEVETNVTILQSTVSPEVPSIDLAVAMRMHDKIAAMNELLDDAEIEDVIRFEYEASSESDDEESDSTFADKADLYAALNLLGQSQLDVEDEDME